MTRSNFALTATRQTYALVLGATVEDLRERAKLTQGALAQAAGLSQVKVSRIEAGDGRLTCWELRGLARALGRRSAGDLLGLVECALHTGEHVPGPRGRRWAAVAVEATWYSATYDKTGQIVSPAQGDRR